MKQEKPKVCINCAKRTTCKTEDELRGMESELIQHMRAISMYGGDPKRAIEELSQNPENKLNCPEYELDQNF
jgi:hypothetical protein